MTTPGPEGGAETPPAGPEGGGETSPAGKRPPRRRPSRPPELPPEAQKIFDRMRALPRAMSLSEVAAVLGVRPQTVAVLERRALRKIALAASELRRPAVVQSPRGKTES